MPDDSTDDEYTFRTRGESLRLVKKRKLDKEFRDRKWEIVQELHMPSEPNEKGEIELLRNPFGGLHRHGYALRDLDTGRVIYVGNHLLKIIANQYQGVTLPVRRRGRPPKNRVPAPA